MGIAIRAVNTPALARRFDALPQQLLPGEKWVPPTTAGWACKRWLYRGGQRRYLLACQGDRDLGRVVVALDRERRAGGGPLGLFGGLLLPADPDVGRALFRELRRLLDNWGAFRLEGPSPKAHPGSGPQLLTGAEAPHAFGHSWSPLRHAQQLGELALTSSAEHYGFRLELRFPAIRRLLRWGRGAAEAGLRVRSLRRSELGVELTRARRFPHPEPHPVDLLRGALAAHHLGYRQGLCLRLERRGVPLGYAFAIPDLTPLLRRFAGRPPTARGLLMLRFKREIERARLLPPLLAPVGIDEGLLNSARCLLVGSLLGQIHRARLGQVDCGPVPAEAEGLRELLGVLEARRDRVFQTFFGKL